MFYNNIYWHPKATSYNMKICCLLRFTSYSGTNYRGCRAAFWMTAALWNGRCRWSLKRLFDVMIQISVLWIVRLVRFWPWGGPQQRVSGCFLNDRCSLKRSLSLVFKTSFWRDDTNFSSLNRAIGQILALRWPAVDPGVGRAPAEICRSWKRSKNRRLYVPVIQY